MHIAHDVPTDARVRVGLGIAVGFAALLGIALAARPEMMSMGMGMIRGLVVGFGL